MKQIEDAKKSYENIPIPEELSMRVMAEIEKAGARQTKNIVRTRRRFIMNRTAAAAAAAVVLLTAGLNTSEAFARELGSVPVVGSVARILTFRSYEAESEDIQVSVEIPSIELISAQLDGLDESVNKEVHAFCEQYAAEARGRAEEYRRAFLETGGTEEEWIAHDIKIKVWYEVKSLSDSYLSLAVMGTDSWSSANSESKYYTLDINAGKWVSLSELLGSGMRAAEENIREQMKQREAETGMDFWDEEWTGLGSDTKFYVNSAGNPVILFDQYEIAPGAAGRQEFEIAK